jgi:integrase
MPRTAKPLNAMNVKHMNVPGYHAVGTVTGLYMQVKNSGAKSWVLRTTVGKKRRDIGLGGYPSVLLAEAQEKARAARQLVLEGTDPIEAKKVARFRLLAEQATGKSFDDCAAEYIASHEAEWSNPKHAAQWRNTLKTYVSPVIGKLLVRHVETQHIKAILQPIWATKTETASRVRGRIEQVLAWATFSGFRSGPNPAQWEGHLEHVFPSPKKVRGVKHHAHVEVDSLHGFMRELAQREGSGPRALEFLILTAVRSANVRKAIWREIDFDNRLWTIPGAADEGGTGQRMKAGVELQVPLSDAAVRLLTALPRMADSDLIFPSATGRVMSDMTLLAVMRRMKVDATPHGFRSTFKTWAADSTSHAREVIEAALAHKLKDKVEAVYFKGNFLDKRTALMQEWANFVTGAKDAKIMPMRRRAA